MLKQIIDNFLERYTNQFTLAGYVMQKLCIKDTVAVFQLKSSEYIINFSFYAELPCRLVVDIYHAGYFPVNAKIRNEKLNQELSFFPFNLNKHENLNNIQKSIGERLGIYDDSKSMDDEDPIPTASFYNLKFPNKYFNVVPSMARIMGTRQVFNFQNYVLNVAKNGEIFYTTSVSYTFAEETIIFKSNDDIYTYKNIDYHDNELEDLLFRLMVEKIAPEIAKHTEYDIINEPEDLVIKAIEIYKMVRI